MIKFFRYKKTNSNQEKSKIFNKSFFTSLFFAILLAAFFRSIFFEPFHIPSGSMKGGLLPGDYIIISKYSYGYSKYSFPFAIIPFEGRVFDKKPERGDVIVFKLPTNPRINYIKRLIGMPGDKIQVKSGVLYINDKEIPKVKIDDFLDDVQFDGKNYKESVAQYKETLPNGISYDVLDIEQSSIADNTDVYIVPEGKYFFMGDNRDRSKDSRFLSDVGFVSEEFLMGKARVIFLSKTDSLIKVWKWGHIIRFNRIFTEIK